MRCCYEATIHYLLRYQVNSVPRVELLDGVHKFDSTSQNSSEDQLLTVLLYGSEKYASNVKKEIWRLTISYLNAPERFAQTLFWPTTFVFIYLFIYFFFFIVWLYRAYCKQLYLTWLLCLVSSTILAILGFTFYICCFIFSFIVSACKNPLYIYIYILYVYIYIYIYILAIFL